jgi:hypothetical protein
MQLKEVVIEKGKLVLEHTFDKPIKPSHRQNYVKKTWPTWSFMS